MREKLLDYLVGGLDSQECEQVRKALQEKPVAGTGIEIAAAVLAAAGILSSLRAPGRSQAKDA